VDRDDWNDHYQSNLSSIWSKRCGSIIHNHTLTRPGYCPFCLGNNSLSVSSRYDPWERDWELWDHIMKHIGRSLWPRHCPRPLYAASFENPMSFRYHLHDTHSLCGHFPGLEERSALEDSAEAGSARIGQIVNRNRKRKRKRKRKAFDEKEVPKWRFVQQSDQVKPDRPPRQDADTSEQLWLRDAVRCFSRF
jgi:hypothetical protein